MKIVAIIQARMESTRLPGKVLMDICGKPVLWHIVNRASKSENLEQIIIATSQNAADDAIEKVALANEWEIYRGSQMNVLERFYKCAVQYDADVIIRFTGDNTLIDPHIIDLGINSFKETPDIDYMYYREGLPIGMAVEIFTFRALERAYKEATDEECLEHVTPYLYKNRVFKAKRMSATGVDYSYLRWTLDTLQDYELITSIYKVLYKNPENIFGFEDIIRQYPYHTEWIGINSDIKQVKVRYEGDMVKNDADGF